jgi:hypothetical protein
MSEPIQLSELHLEIMKLLWLEWNEAQPGTAVTGGLTRDEIFQRLKGRVRINWNPPRESDRPGSRGGAGIEKSRPQLVNKAETLKGHLKRLCHERPERLRASRTSDYPGAPYVYMINDITTVTYSSTASMLLEIFRKKHIEQRDLIGRLRTQTTVSFLAGSPTPEELTHEIVQQINWCRARSYVEYVAEHQTELRPMTRLLYEYKFLEFVAAHARTA